MSHAPNQYSNTDEDKRISNTERPIQLSTPLTDLLIYTNLFLAISVTSLVFETFILLDIKEFDFNYPLFLFCATVFLYGFHSIFKILKLDKTLLSERHVWLLKHSFIFYTIMALALVLGLFALSHFALSFLFSLIPIIIVSLAYTLPLIPSKTKFISIRDIPGIKIFLISLVLSITTVLLPAELYKGYGSVNHFALLFVFIRRMLFIFAITIPFDIRDVELDKAKGTLTIPVMLGEKKAKAIALLALFVFMTLSIFDYQVMRFNNLYLLVAFIISAFISAVLLVLSNARKSDFFYALFLEGLMFVQYLLVYIAMQLK